MVAPRFPEEPPEGFPERRAPFRAPSPRLQLPLPAPLTVCPGPGHPRGLRRYLTEVLIRVSPVTDDAEHLPLCVSVISVLSLEKRPFGSFARV